MPTQNTYKKLSIYYDNTWIQTRQYFKRFLQTSLRHRYIYNEITVFFPQPWLMGSLNCGCEEKDIWGGNSDPPKGAKNMRFTVMSDNTWM